MKSDDKSLKNTVIIGVVVTAVAAVCYIGFCIIGSGSLADSISHYMKKLR